MAHDTAAITSSSERARPEIAEATRNRPGRLTPATWTRFYCVWFPVAAVLVGVALRARQYFYNRSLWLDEISVTQDITGRTFGQLMHTTPNGQAAPIGWFWAERLSYLVFGSQEFALRIVPLIASALSLALMPYVARRLVGRWAMPVVVLLFATSPSIIYYSSEVKQYSSDVACVLLIVAVTLAMSDTRARWRAAALWAVTAGSVVWFSQPGILAVAVCGIALSISWSRRGSGWRKIVSAGVPPLVVLALDYDFALRAQSKSTGLKNYWALGYPPKPLALRSGSKWLYHDVNDTINNPAGLHHPVLVLLLGATGLAVLVSRARWRWTTALLMSPLVLAVVLAVTRIYPLRQRLALYLVPFVFMLVSAALRIVEQPRRMRPPVKSAFVATVAVLLAITGFSGVRKGVLVLAQPLDQSAARQSVAFIADNIKPGDVVVREAWAGPAWDFYSQRHAQVLPNPGTFTFINVPTGCASVPGLARLRPGERVWVMLDHRGSNEPPNARDVWIRYFGSVGTLSMHYIPAHGDGGAFLYDITGSGPAPPASWLAHGCLQLTGL